MTIGQIGIGNYGYLMDGTRFSVPDTPLNRMPHQEMTIILYPGSTAAHEKRYHPATPCKDVPIQEKCMMLDGKHVTLDGKPATVAGFKNSFATVAQLNSALKVEFAWETCHRILKAGGQFHS